MELVPLAESIGSCGSFRCLIGSATTGSPRNRGSNASPGLLGIGIPGTVGSGGSPGIAEPSPCARAVAPGSASPAPSRTATAVLRTRRGTPMSTGMVQFGYEPGAAGGDRAGQGLQG